MNRFSKGLETILSKFLFVLFSSGFDLKDLSVMPNKETMNEILLILCLMALCSTLLNGFNRNPHIKLNLSFSLNMMKMSRHNYIKAKVGSEF